MVISLIHSTNSTILSSSQNKLQITSTAIRPPSYLKNPRVVLPNLPQLYQKQSVLEQIKNLTTIPLVADTQHNTTTPHKMQMILDFISDRIELHQNIGEQRENWNSLLLNSINMITLTATAMSGIAGTTSEIPNLPLKVSSVLLFSAATGMLLIMNKIQPSQLVEEQRNAVRLFKQLQTRIQTHLSRQNPTQDDVDDAFERVLALDRAYPLPLLGAMLDKFPDNFKPAVWWPVNKSTVNKSQRLDINGQKMGSNNNNNGWNEKLEVEMREIVKVVKKKDIEDYERLGNKALKLNKMLAVLGPLLTGVAGLSSAFVGHGGPWAGLLAAGAGSLASVVNMVEHGGQVGMVFEMYRNCGGFFKLLEETVESNLEEYDFDNRENGELFEMKMALHLGRSLSELRDLADKSKRNGGVVNEFASKLF